MKILSAKLILPAWQKAIIEPNVQAETQNIDSNELTAVDSGCPLSVLPAWVQDRFREGQPVAPEDCIPVPTRKGLGSIDPA